MGAMNDDLRAVRCMVLTFGFIMVVCIAAMTVGNPTEYFFPKLQRTDGQSQHWKVVVGGVAATFVFASASWWALGRQSRRSCRAGI